MRIFSNFIETALHRVSRVPDLFGYTIIGVAVCFHGSRYCLQRPVVEVHVNVCCCVYHPMGMFPPEGRCVVLESIIARYGVFHNFAVAESEGERQGREVACTEQRHVSVFT